MIAPYLELNSHGLSSQKMICKEQIFLLEGWQPAKNPMSLVYGKREKSE